MKWLACELHTHTIHSDGSQTLGELAAGAASLGFDAIALTDHNTMTGLADKEQTAAEHGLLILPGMEWTTFHGHMVTIGLSEYVDWREVGHHQIGNGIQAVHRLGGIAGLAHPFRIGSPACTGCYWEYDIQDWSLVDYIEVWSGIFASIQTVNQRAYALWTDKLNEGHRITATSGRDWHAQTATTEPLSVTYLGIPANTDPTEQKLIQALQEGCATVTIGPQLGFQLKIHDAIYEVGSVIPMARTGATDKAEAQVRITVDFSVRSGLWSLPEQAFRLRVCSDRGIELEAEVDNRRDIQDNQLTQPQHLCTDLTLQSGTRKWLRAELWGTVQGVYTLIAFTNAIYFAQDEEGVEA